MVNYTKKKIHKFIENFCLDDFPYKNGNIHYVEATSNYKTEFKSAQKLMQNGQFEKAIDVYLRLISKEACQLLLSGLLYSLFFAVYRARHFEESLSIIKLAKKINDKFTPYLCFDFECYINKIENHVNND